MNGRGLKYKPMGFLDFCCRHAIQKPRPLTKNVYVVDGLCMSVVSVCLYSQQLFNSDGVVNSSGIINVRKMSSLQIQIVITSHEYDNTVLVE